MLRLADLKVLTKLTGVIGLIAVIVGGCIWYAQGRMTQIDDAYSAFIDQEAEAALLVRRSNRLIFELNYWVYRVIAETEDGQMQAASRGFEAAVPAMRQTIAELREKAPALAARIDAQAVRIDRFVQDTGEVRRLGMANQNAEAIVLVHKAIDPTFSTMVEEGNKLGDAIRDSMRQGSAELTTQTNATRHTLMAFSGLGILAGFLVAFLVASYGITRPLGSLVTVLQRMAKGEIDAQIPEARRGDEIGAVGKAVEGIKTMVAQKAAEQAEIKRIADEAAARERKRTMVELADGFEAAVGGIVGMVSSSATELQATAQQMSSAAGE
ncbi:HAMP domain-containing protein, partial [Methylobacterium sp. J-067]|uniref:HAMP domain-containing protein n=1 Tax=Methylobacterium sp. J-067 TaxID=2836648 RepID=UPI001FBA9087